VLSTEAEISGEQGLGHPGIELQKDIFEVSFFRILIAPGEKFWRLNAI